MFGFWSEASRARQSRIILASMSWAL